MQPSSLFSLGHIRKGSRQKAEMLIAPADARRQQFQRCFEITNKHHLTNEVCMPPGSVQLLSPLIEGYQTVARVREEGAALATVESRGILSQRLEIRTFRHGVPLRAKSIAR